MMSRRQFIQTSATVAAAHGADRSLAGNEPGTGCHPTAALILEERVPARMRDGVTLYADVYRPAAEGRYPVLLLRTGLSRDGLGGVMAHWLEAVRAVRAGYVVIFQDARGSGTSEGKEGFIAMTREGPDGHDTVEWAAALPYSSGAVGMFGISGNGVVQYVAAQERPPHLKAIAPGHTGPDVSAAMFRQGALDMSWLLARVNNDGKRRLTVMAREGASPAELAGYMRQLREAQERMDAEGYRELPLANLASLAPLGLSESLAPALAAGPGQPWPFTVDLASLRVPALIIGGWYDLLLPQSIDAYRALRQQGQPVRLLVGPWTHGDTGGRRSTIGEMSVASASGGEGDLTGIHLRWFDHWLKGLDNGVDREPPVSVFVMGENRWRRLDDWPPAGLRTESWFLQPGNGLSTEAPVTATAMRYTYDPADPVPTRGGTGLFGGLYAAGVKDQAPLSARPDVLTFSSAPLSQPLTIMGPVSAELWAGSSAPDTDFVVRLVDVQPSGYMHNLCDGIIRARYRESSTEPKWLEAGQTYRFEIDLWSTAHTFKPGHRIGLQVTSSNFPRYDRNLNTNEALGKGSRGEIAQQTLWMGADRLSHLRLPVVPRI